LPNFIACKLGTEKREEERRLLKCLQSVGTQTFIDAKFGNWMKKFHLGNFAVRQKR